MAVAAGADALGFIFYPTSPRFVQPEKVAEIITRLPPFISKVGVFVNSSPDEIHKTIERTGVNVLQFHGDESPGFCAKFSLPVIKAFRVKDQTSLGQIKEYRASAFLLDSYVPGQPGGTGEKFNWDLALQARQSTTRPIILAGGLTPENIGDAVAKVLPFAVDVSSGVELSPGKKDPEKVKRFIALARAAAESSAPL
jgi:phosphoribosylanthranilate isomerase